MKINGPLTDEEVEERIKEFFDRNYGQMRQEGGHVLAEGTKQQALQQVVHYWRKLRGIATTVTDTEVKLSLPDQTTASGRKFVIEGVVDIVRDGERVLLYDVKTHEEAEVRAERKLYQDQLNVYAHIWKGITGRSLDGTAIIATQLPRELREAIRTGDADKIEAALEQWNPVIDLPFDEDDVRRTIEDFGRCVDAIEDGKFTPPAPEKLKEVYGQRKRKDYDTVNSVALGSEMTFARRHCQTCDARFTCKPYRHYETQGHPRQWGAKSAKEREQELDAWIEENLTEEA